MTSTQLSTIAHVSSVRRDPEATPPPAIDLASICAGGCAAAAAEFARMAEKLRLALPRPERMDAAVAAVLPELASGSAALRRLGEAIAELDQLRKPLQFEPIELGDLSMGMLADWKERAPSHSLELALPGELPTVLASPRYAPLALNILIEAGVSMAPSGSPVRVSIRPQNESVLVSVQYAGAPLSDGDLDRLFEPYLSAGGAAPVPGRRRHRSHPRPRSTPGARRTPLGRELSWRRDHRLAGHVAADTRPPDDTTCRGSAARPPQSRHRGAGHPGA